MNTRLYAIFLAAGLGLTSQAWADAGRIKPQEGAKVYIISPANGETLSNPVIVRFGLKGMGVAPAGVKNPKTGHHHLLIDLGINDVDLKAPLPFSDQTHHFGGGQTEVALELKPGIHTLQLLFADWKHTSFDPPLVSEKIGIKVK